MGIDHTINTDGTANIRLQWSWAGNEEDIDGFMIFLRQSTSSSAYVMGTTPAQEQIFYVTAGRRAFLIYGVAANQYYTFGVQAYRIVDPDVNAAGIIKSAMVQPAAAGENPYRPSATVTFAGDLTGTINGSAIGNLATRDTVGTSEIDDGAVTQIVAVDDYTGYDLLASPDSPSTGYGKRTIMAQTASFTSTGEPVFITFEGDTYATFAANTDGVCYIFRRDNADVNVFVSNVTLSGSTAVKITTSTAHGLSTGEYVSIYDIGGATELNGGIYKITVVDSTNFTLDDTRSDWFTAYTSGGRVRRVIMPALRYGTQLAGTDITAPFQVSDIDTGPVAGHSYLYIGAFKNGHASVNSFGEESTLIAMEIKR